MTDVDITAPSVLRGLHKELQTSVKMAAGFGWTGRKAGSGGLILRSPDGEHIVRIPITVNHTGILKTIARDIVRYTPDHLREEYADAVIDAGTPAQARNAADFVLNAGGAFGPGMVSGLTAPEPELVDLTALKPAVTIVSVEPWMARVSSNGVKSDLYPSQATLERTWSDGSKDYACAWDGCDYTAERPRSTSSHYRIHVQDSGVRADTTPTVFDQKVDGYRTVRVAHLAKEIKAALDAESDSINDSLPMDDLARRIAEHIIRERLAKGKEKIEEEPQAWTAEDILARMRRLLMRDEQTRAEQAEAQAANLRAQIAEVEQSRDHYKAQSEQRGQALTTLAAMAAEETREG